MKTIAMYDLEGHLLEVFEVETYVELEKTLKIPAGGISGCVSNKQMSAVFRQFREYTKGSKIISKIGDVSNLTTRRAVPVHKYYKGNYVCSYESVSEAARKNNIDTGYLTVACQSEGRNTAGGFEWAYARPQRITN